MNNKYNININNNDWMLNFFLSDLLGSWETLLDPQEKTHYVRFFRRADAEGKGVLLKDEAIAFLKKANVPDNILNEVSEFSFEERKGNTRYKIK